MINRKKSKPRNEAWKLTWSNSDLYCNLQPTHVISLSLKVLICAWPSSFNTIKPARWHPAWLVSAILCFFSFCARVTSGVPFFYIPERKGFNCIVAGCIHYPTCVLCVPVFVTIVCVSNCPSQRPFLHLSEAVWDWGPSPALCCHSEHRQRAAWLTAQPTTHIFSSLMLPNALLSAQSPLLCGSVSDMCQVTCPYFICQQRQLSSRGLSDLICISVYLYKSWWPFWSQLVVKLVPNGSTV